MKRHVPGLHSRQQQGESPVEGLFLVRVEWASYRWHPQKPFLGIRFVVLEPRSFERRSFSGRLYCTGDAGSSDALSNPTVNPVAFVPVRSVSPRNCSSVFSVPSVTSAEPRRE